MKIFSIKRETNKYHRITEIWLCFLRVKIKLLHKYRIRVYHWSVPGVRQYLEPSIFDLPRVHPASNKYETEYFAKEMFEKIK